MKKQIKTILFCSLVCITLFAALPLHAQLSAGIRAGANLVTEPQDNLYHDFLALPYGGLLVHTM